MDGDDVDERVVLRNHHRSIPMKKTLRQLRRMVKSSESTLQRKMSTLEGGQFVLLVKALWHNRSGQVHGVCLIWWVLVDSSEWFSFPFIAAEVVEVVGSPGLKESFEAYFSCNLFLNSTVLWNFLDNWLRRIISVFCMLHDNILEKNACGIHICPMASVLWLYIHRSTTTLGYEVAISVYMFLHFHSFIIFLLHELLPIRHRWLALFSKQSCSF